MQKAISKDGTVIAYEKSGQGPALVLVGGAFMDHASHAPLAAALAPYFTVYNYDRRGHGESTDTLPYTLQREIEDIEALINIIGESVYLYGVSSGAALAFEAASSGVGVRKLAMYEPPYAVDHNGDRNPPADTVKQLSTMVAEDRRDDVIEFFMTKLVGLPPQAAAGMKQSPMWPGLKAIAHTVVYDATISASRNGDFLVPTQQMAALNTPTIVLDGGASWDWIRATAKAVAAAIPHAAHRTLEGQEHSVDPEVITPVLRDFFTK